MGVDREVESLIAESGDATVPRPNEPQVERERDPLVLTPEDADALPAQVEHLAQFIETLIPTAPPAPEAILPGVTDSTTTFVLGSLVAAVVLALLAVLLARRSSKKRGTDVLLVGPSDAGKTALLAALAHGRTVPTHTSMQPNLAVLAGKTRLVDIPGHARLRAQGLADHLPAARGVLFVVDAATVARSGPAVAEHLHEVLAALLALPGASPPPLALVAAKRDLAPQGASRVRAVLERELDRRRQARVDVDSDEADETKGGLGTVGARGAPFRLAEWEGGEIAVLACSLREKEGDGLVEVREWIDGLE